MQDFWSNFKKWLAQPYSEDMSALHWFLFLGLLIALTFLWSQILRHLKLATGD